MLPMITVAGTRQSRRFNPRWGAAAARSHWSQNPTLSFGTGAPMTVPPFMSPPRVRNAMPAWKKAGSCCASCHEGHACEGGCGDKCNCGKEGRSANPKILHRVKAKAKDVARATMALVVGDPRLLHRKPSRLANRARSRMSMQTRAPGCWVKGKYVVPCPKTQLVFR